MTPVCIHGFRAEHCASCRTCPHGLTSSRCGRCRAAETSAARRLAILTSGNQPPSVKHQGFEIFWVPALDGWQYRAPDSAASAESYRSVFLARKAIDRLGSAQPVAASSKTR